ncbi:hypothetical protein FIBSPDRAFT_900076 [Athelia psychrophila]|uniref:DEAD/DEAH-box helicase domain-containing protein n=1 Tax=Athelia psychrophila TaxID=1759441 RepID=A0A165YUH4_9AGAM|nr:hypothetical protein FIBSPDRAFT_900076 [Fibularhizoctonia sp. CBS 109695]
MPKINWNPERIREAIDKHFSKRACWYQIKTAQALYAKRDVVGKVPTGSGKTLSFFGGLVMAMEEEPDGEKMVIIASPLNLLSQQNVEMLQAAPEAIHHWYAGLREDEEQWRRSTWRRSIWPLAP